MGIPKAQIVNDRNTRGEEIMSTRIISLTTLVLSTLSAGAAFAQTTTPGGGPQPTLKDYVHPPSLSAPAALQRAPASAPAKRRPVNHNTVEGGKPNSSGIANSGRQTKGRAARDSGGTRSPSSAPPH